LVHRRSRRPPRARSRATHEDARDVARRKMTTKAFARSRDERKRVEMRFAHLKTHHGFERMRLRGLSGARDEFHLAAIVQNLKTLALRILAPPQRTPTFVVVASALVPTSMPPRTAGGDHQKRVERHHDRNRSLFRQHRSEADVIVATIQRDPNDCLARRRSDRAHAQGGEVRREYQGFLGAGYLSP
jgi:hypothetical protein